LNTRVYDVAVIGAGVFGTWIAYQLRQSKYKVLLMDAFGAGNSRSSSGDESRIIRFGYGSDEIYTRMAMDSLREWKRLFKQQKCPQLFQKTGVLWMGKKDDRYMTDSLRVLKRVGAKVQELPAQALCKKYPQFDTGEVTSALLEPENGALLGRQAVRATCDAYRDAGGKFLLGKIIPPEIKSFSALFTKHGEKISAGTFVFACGPWLGKIFPELLGTRLFVTRQEVFYFGAPSGNTYKPEKMPIWLHLMDDQVYGFPDLENRGVKVAFDEHGPPFDPDIEERLVNRDSLSRMRTYLKCRVPGLAQAPVIESRVCQYENTSNGDFLLDRHPEADNVWLAGGGSGHGFKHGPAVGKYMCARIEGKGKPEPRFSLASKNTVQSRTVF